MDLKPSEAVWFDDGNIALECEGTVFRVFRGILVKASPIFADLFTLPQGPDTESFEGVPLVHMPDSERDMRYFLLAIHDASFYVPQPSTPSDPDVTIAVARLSTKYEVSFLRKRATDYLAALYPSTLSEYSAERLGSWNDIEVANLAREIDFPCILPAAFYQCATFPVASILSGVHVESREPASLHPAILAPVLAGRAKLMGHQVSHVHSVFSRPWPASAKCSSRVKCVAAAAWEIDNIMELMREGDCNPLKETYFDNLAIDICPTCYDTAMADIQAGLQKIWDDLPEIFGLPSWDELNKHKNTIR